MLPLDPHIEIVNLKFPKHISIDETDCQALKQEGILFREKYQNNYCYLRLKENRDIELSLFKSDHSEFEKIEDDYLYSAISFKIKDIKQTEIIIHSLS